MVENKRKIIKRISSIFIACASALMLCISPFLPKIQPKTIIASADAVEQSYSFNGSSLVTVASVIKDGVGYRYGFTNFDCSFDNFNGYVSAVFNFKSNYYDLGYGTFTQSYNFQDESYLNTYVDMYYSNDSWLYNYRFEYDIFCDSEFNCNVVRVRIYSEKYTINSYTTGLRTYINYIDNNDNILSIRIDADSSSSSDYSYINNYFFYEDRYYYLANTFTDNDYFNNGYNEGYLDGKAEGEEIGYGKGKNAGWTLGYNSGYQDGVNGEQYTFFNLISAVIDAPVQAFMGLFNFELLGVNLAGFFTGLLTVAFIITIVRMVL